MELGVLPCGHPANMKKAARIFSHPTVTIVRGEEQCMLLKKTCMQLMHVCRRTYVCMYVCTYVCTYVCMYVCTYVCMYVCMYVCVCICMCICNITSQKVVGRSRMLVSQDPNL